MRVTSQELAMRIKANVGWRWQHNAVQGMFIVYVSIGWWRAGVSLVSSLRLLACVYALWSSVWLYLGGSKRRNGFTIFTEAPVFSSREGRLSWCAKECLAGEVLGVDNPPAHLQQTFITTVVVFIAIEEWELTQFLQAKSWKLAAPLRGSPGFQHLAWLSSHWAALRTMKGLTHISLCFSPKFPRRMMRGHHWFWRRTAQSMVRGNSHWGSSRIRWPAPREAKVSSIWGNHPLLRALLEENVFSLTPNFEAMTSHILRRVHWLRGKALLKEKAGAESWRKSPRTSSHQRSRAFAFFYQVTQEWPGLPSGVKFEPSDEQLVGHLAAKVGIGNSRPHPLINEFILTLEERDGICYTHPENLPGVKQDGSSTHFFHRTGKAYTTGTRKRRKVDNFRWHKTGKTRKVCENGEQIGCKKIMVLYTTPAKGSKSVRTDWVMHQYHLGTEEDEKEDEFVVSKIQLKQCDKNDPGIPEEEDAGTSNSKGDPSTPTTSTPPQPCSKKQHSCLDRIEEEHMFRASSPQAADLDPKLHLPSKPIEAECDGQIYIPDVTSWLAGESQCFEDSQEQMVGHFSCEEILGNGSCQENVEETNNIPGLSDCGRIGGNGHEKEMHQTSYSDLANLDFDTPPDGPIPLDSQFSSQESLLGWLKNFGNSQ